VNERYKVLYKFRDWTIETKLDVKLNVVIDRDENHLIMIDEDKDLFALIYPSELGEGLAFDKMSWASQFHVLPSEKKIIITSARNKVEE
jgi:hypothetical protein